MKVSIPVTAVQVVVLVTGSSVFSTPTVPADEIVNALIDWHNVTLTTANKYFVIFLNTKRLDLSMNF